MATPACNVKTSSAHFARRKPHYQMASALVRMAFSLTQPFRLAKAVDRLVQLAPVIQFARLVLRVLTSVQLSA